MAKANSLICYINPCLKRTKKGETGVSGRDYEGKGGLESSRLKECNENDKVLTGLFEASIRQGKLVDFTEPGMTMERNCKLTK